jgi:hypothetical protein
METVLSHQKQVPVHQYLAAQPHNQLLKAQVHLFQAQLAPTQLIQLYHRSKIKRVRMIRLKTQDCLATM